MTNQYDYDNLKEYRKLFGNRSFVSKSAESKCDKERKDRNNDLGYDGKHDFLEFIQYTGDQLCLIPCSSQTYHDRKYQSTHNGHDLWNGKFEYDFRKCLKPFYISNNGKMWDKYISCTCGKKSCTDRRCISDHKSNTQHTGGTVAELCDRWCNKPDDDQWYTEVNELTENIFHCNNDIQNSNSQ